MINMDVLDPASSYICKKTLMTHEINQYEYFQHFHEILGLLKQPIDRWHVLISVKLSVGTFWKGWHITGHLGLFCQHLLAFSAFSRSGTAVVSLLSFFVFLNDLRYLLDRACHNSNFSKFVTGALSPSSLTLHLKDISRLVLY